MPKTKPCSFSLLISTLLLLSFFFSSCSSFQNKKQINTKAIEDSTFAAKDTLLITTDSTVNKLSKKETNQTPALTQIPPKAVSTSCLPDFSVYKNVTKKKKAFFDFLKPLIKHENDRLLEQRDFILKQHQRQIHKDRITPADSSKLATLIKRYQCKNKDINTETTYRELLNKVDIIPLDLALTQAAIESSWGTSYFARLGNNLYGRWCFKPGCGLVPRKRQKGLTHEVAVYKSIPESIRSYMHLLNTNDLFERLRQERAINRRNHQDISGEDMAKGLKAYSAKGDAYIRDIQSMIRVNKALMSPQNKSNKTKEASVAIQNLNQN